MSKDDFITLTIDDQFVYPKILVRPEHISAIFERKPSDPFTSVQIDGIQYAVRETPEEIFKLIDGWKIEKRKAAYRKKYFDEKRKEWEEHE